MCNVLKLRFKVLYEASWLKFKSVRVIVLGHVIIHRTLASREIAAKRLHKYGGFIGKYKLGCLKRNRGG